MPRKYRPALVMTVMGAIPFLGLTVVFGAFSYWTMNRHTDPHNVAHQALVTAVVTTALQLGWGLLFLSLFLWPLTHRPERGVTIMSSQQSNHPDRPPRPSVDIVPYDDHSWEVFIDAETGLNASVKVGYEMDGDAFVVVDPDTDGELRHKNTVGYAHFIAKVDDE